MSQQIEGPRKTFTAGEILPAFRRVLISAATGTHGPTVMLADATEPSIGVTEVYAASGDPVTIRMVTAEGTRKMMATAAAIIANNPVYAANDGYVASTGTVVEGKALESTEGAAGDILEVLPLLHVDLVASAGITLPTVTFNGATTVNKLIVPDNLAEALSIVEGVNKYVTVVTTNGAEGLAFGKAVTLSSTLAVAGVATLAGNVANTAGIGITGTAAAFVTSVEKIGTIIKTTILIDLQGLYAGGTAGDLIGANGAGVCHLGQITEAVNGTIFAGRMKCLETPATGDDDIDLYSATEATGVEDTAISALTATQLCNSGDLTNASDIALTAVPAANKYLYLVAQTGDAATDAYTAGILLIELWGKAA